jgi:hypothetical protein
MNVVPVELGISTADAENVAIRFEGGELFLTLVDSALSENSSWRAN